MNGSALLRWKKNTLQTSAYKMVFGVLCFSILQHPTVQSNLKNRSQDSYKYIQVTGLWEDKVHQLPQGLLILIYAEAKNLGFKAPATEKQHNKK